jgi:pimeloyl-ACP methyl ester carboxylesterase
MIDEEPARKGRPILLAAHSYGCQAAHHLASRLGPRVRHTTIIASRGPAAAATRAIKVPDALTDEGVLKWAYDLCARPPSPLATAHAHPILAPSQPSRRPK